jgi:nucleoside-diphosphate-sugar epimerase
MDFFYMDDLCQVVKFTIDANVKQQTINCSYQQKYKLSDIATIINNLSDYNVETIIEKENLGLSYYGEYNLHLFDINLIGLHSGIKKTYEELLISGNFNK